MKLRAFLAAALALGIAIGPAAAFQETQIGTDAPAAKSDDVAKQQVAPSVFGLSPAAEADAEASEGTEVRIPGLGRLGVLPKMDFGLELLYGQSDTGEPAVNPQDAPLEDFSIRGTVKHNF